MKKAKSDIRKSAVRKTPLSDVDEYIAGIPPQSRSAFLKLRAMIRAAVPREAIETISYRIPAFKHDGVTIWYAAFSNHCSLFPTASVIQAFKDELAGFPTSKGTIQFPLDKPLPTGLIKKIVKARFALMEDNKRR